MRERAAIVLVALGAVILLVTATSVGTHTNERPSDSTDVPIALSASALPDPARRVPQQCLDAVPIASTQASAFAWSPNGSALAVASDADRVLVARAPTWSLKALTSGREPHWSPSGKLIAVARGTDAVVVDATTGRDLATLAPAAPGYGWAGETLLYWDGTRLRGWSDGHTGTVGSHVPDVTPLGRDVRLSVSADGTRYALTSAHAVMYGDTADGRLSLLARVSAIAWSAFGANALLTYETGDRAFFASTKLLFGAQALPAVFGAWSPDGTQAFFGPVPSGTAWDLIGWAGSKNGDATRIPSGLTAAAFAPMGDHLAGIDDGQLRVFTCGDAPGATTYITRKRASEIVDRTGDLLKVNISDSKLVRWGDIAGMLTGDWAVRDPAADTIAPTDLVWLLRYAGEARRPDGVKWDQPTVNLILYVLDARDGTRLARRIANGTWWIGEPFESLVDRAPDPTSHPFEAAPGATNAIQMPTPRPTPTLKTTATGASLARAESVEAGWRLDYPDGWWASRSGFGGAVLTTQDPAVGRSGVVNLPSDYHGGPSVYVEVWPNPEHLDASAFADRRFAGNTNERKQSQAAVTLAGQAAVTWLVRDGPNPPDNSFFLKRYWIVPTLHPERVLMISAAPADSAYAAEIDRAIASLALMQPVSVPRAPDISRQQVLERFASMKSPPARVEAKLVTYAEAEAADRSFAINRLLHDPDGLVWIVAVSDPTGASLGPTKGFVAVPYRWEMYVTPAYSDDPGEGLWGQEGSQGDWPAIFDTLTDRCC